MDLGTLTLKTGTISSHVGKTDDNSTAEQWIETARTEGAKAVTVPGTVGKSDKGKTIYTGTAQEVVNRLRRATDTYNENKPESEHIGVRVDVKDAGKDKVTVNFAVTAKVRRPRKNKTVAESLADNPRAAQNINE